MSLTLQLKRLTGEELEDYLGSPGELVVNTDTNKLILLDGVTLGGHAFDSVDRSSTKDHFSINNRWLFVEDGKIVDVKGKPIREIGFNTMQLLANHALMWGDSANNGEFLHRELTRLNAHNIHHIRAMSVPMFWRGDHHAFNQNQERYWKRFGQALDMCYNMGVGVQLDFIKNYQTIPDYVDGYVSDWADKSSTTYQYWYNTCFVPLMEKYGDHPAISSWSIVNELNMVMEFGNTPKAQLNSDGTVSEWHGTRAEYPRSDNRHLISEDEFVQIQANIGEDIHANDPIGRMVVSGNNGRNTSRQGSTEFMYDGYAELINRSSDVLTFHVYDSHVGNNTWSDFVDEINMYRAIGEQLGKPAFLQEVDPNLNERVIPHVDKVENMLKAVYDSGIQLTFPWMWVQRETMGENEYHPEHVDERGRTKMDIVDRYNRKMRAEGYKAPWKRQFTERSSVGARPTGVWIGNQTDTKLELPVQQFDRANGFCYAFWYKCNDTIAGYAAATIAARTNANAYNGTDSVDGFWMHAFPGTKGGLNVGISKLAAGGGAWIAGTHGNQWLSDDEWAHIVIQYDDAAGPTHGFTVYINGRGIKNIIPDTTGQFTMPSNLPLVFGAHSSVDGLENPPYWAGLRANSPFNIADAMVFNRALTDGEAQSLFYHRRIPSGTLQANWKFEGNAIDSVSGLAGTEYGATAYDNSFTLPTKY